jgi:HSP20 family molecular chaperone IbpA
MIQIRHTIDVNVPLRAAYNQWTQFEEFPRFMEGVHEVRHLDDAHLHWRAHRHGRELEWDSEITDQVPDQLIAWRDVNGSGNHGSIRFQSLRDDLTRVEMVMDTKPMGGPETHLPFQQEVQQRIEQDLFRFKRMLEQQGVESGAWRGQIHGARTTQTHTAQDAQDAQDQRRSPNSPGAGEQSSESGTSQTWLPGLLQAWEEPMVMMRKMSDEMDQLFERFLGRPMAFRFGQGGVTGKWMPTVEVTQRDDELVICAELPGLKKEAVNVEIRQGKLLIEGERPRPVAQIVPQGFRRSERNYGPFYRMIPLPESIDTSHCTAQMEDGVLEVALKLLPSGAQLGQRINIDG